MTTPVDAAGFSALLNAVFAAGMPADALASRFVDCGGDSIMAVTLAARCHRQYGVRVPASLILRAPRLQDVLDFVAERAKDAPPAAPARLREPAGRFPQNAAQQLIFFAHAVNPRTTAYNIPVMLRTASAISAPMFGQAVDDAARWFPMLSCRFAQDITGPWFEAAPAQDVELRSFASLAEAVEGFVQPFDLGQGALVRAGMVPFNGKETVLLVDFSHIAADGLSVGMFVQALKDRLVGKGDAADARTFWPELGDDASVASESFWQERLRQATVQPVWPMDRPQPAAAPLGYGVEYLLVDASLAAQLRAFGARAGVTPFGVVLTAYAVLQASFTLEWRGNVGVVTSGRADAEVADVFGMFVNVVILPFAFAPEQPVGPALRALANDFLATMDHQAYPFQKQLHHVRNRDDRVRPTLDALLAFQNIDYQKIDIAGGKFRSFCEAKREAQLPQVIHVFDQGAQGYEIQWEYCTHRYDAATIALFAGNFLKILQRLVASTEDATLDSLVGTAGSASQADPIAAADFDF